MKRFFIAQIFLLMITACGYLISNMGFADESYPYSAVPAQPQYTAVPAQPNGQSNPTYVSCPRCGRMYPSPVDTLNNLAVYTCPYCNGQFTLSQYVSTDLPPTFVVPAPPPVILIPGTDVYYVPDVEVDILFCNGDWYRPYGGRWYIARHYNGPWGYLIPPRVPRVLINLPLNHRSILSGNRRIPYEDLQKNWGRWEREGHLDRGEGLRGKGPRGHQEGHASIQAQHPSEGLRGGGPRGHERYMPLLKKEERGKGLRGEGPRGHPEGHAFIQAQHPSEGLRGGGTRGHGGKGR